MSGGSSNQLGEYGDPFLCNPNARPKENSIASVCPVGLQSVLAVRQAI